MTTGDLKNNLRKLQSELRAVKYGADVDFERLMRLFIYCCWFYYPRGTVLLHTDMHSICSLCCCKSLFCMPWSGIVSKWLNISPKFFHRLIAPSF